MECGLVEDNHYVYETWNCNAIYERMRGGKIVSIYAAYFPFWR